MSTQTQPAPVLAWHREAARMLAADSKRFCEISVYMTPDWIAEHIAAHDPHAAQNATTVRLLEEVTSHLHELIKDEFDDPPVGIFGWNSEHELVATARAHLAALQQEGAAK